MSMNCNDTYIFSQELKRMCAAFHTCTDCPIRSNTGCPSATHITPKVISIVQKWSDENPKVDVTITQHKLIKDFMEDWGADVPEEVLPLYSDLLEWLNNEFRFYGKEVKI